MALKRGRSIGATQAILVGSVIPAGTIQSFGGGTVPEGWLLCDGSTKVRADYPALFAAIGTAHGQGNGTTTFHLPDLRGRFLRGLDATAGRDPDKASRTAANAGGATGNNVGSVQGQQTASHQHLQANREYAINHLFYGGVTVSSGSRSPVDLSSTTQPYTSSVGGNETRPANANVLFIIKV